MKIIYKEDERLVKIISENLMDTFTLGVIGANLGNLHVSFTVYVAKKQNEESITGIDIPLEALVKVLAGDDLEFLKGGNDVA